MACLIKDVIVIDASGSIGPHIVSALLTNGFSTLLTRAISLATFPPEITVHRTDYSTPSLISVFKNQDAVISAIASFSTHQKALTIDAAIEAGVKHFISSEYGVDTSLPQISEFLPATMAKKIRPSICRARSLQAFYGQVSLSVRSLTRRSTTQDLWVGTFQSGKPLFSTAEMLSTKRRMLLRSLVQLWQLYHLNFLKNEE